MQLQRVSDSQVQQPERGGDSAWCRGRCASRGSSQGQVAEVGFGSQVVVSKNPAEDSLTGKLRSKHKRRIPALSYRMRNKTLTCQITTSCWTTASLTSPRTPVSSNSRLIKSHLSYSWPARWESLRLVLATTD